MDFKKKLNILFYVILIIATLYFLKRKFIVPKVTKAELSFVEYNTNIPIDINALTDKVIVVNFWQTWCGPCLQEMPDLNEMSDKWEDIQVYCVSDETPSKISAYQKKYANIIFVEIEKMSAYGVSQFPTTYIYNKQGTKVFSKIGAKNWSDDNFIATLKKNWN